MSKSFLVLFFKKELLPSFLPERDRMRLRQSRGPIALQVFVLTRKLEAILR
jgi:hypothetical protein